MANQPKSYRKFLAGSVTAALVASAVAPAVSAAGFSDVPSTDDHAENIAKAVELGLINGYDDGTFAPYQDITRGQVAKVLSRYLLNNGEVDTSSTEQFSDVSADVDAELAEAALVVKETEVFQGSNGELRPADNITRQEMATVVARLFQLTDKENAEPTVTDIDEAWDVHAENINLLSEWGVTTETEFNPMNNVKRAQFASFMVRAIDTLEEVAAPAVESVSAINPNSVELVLNTSVEEFSKNDVTVTNEDGDKQYVKSVEIVEPEVSVAAAGETTKVKVEFYDALESGKSYTFDVKVGEEVLTQTLDFVIGDAASITVEDQTVAATVPTAIEYTVLDENGLDITSTVDVDFESNATITDGKIALNANDYAFVVISVTNEDGSVVKSEQVKVTGEAIKPVAISNYTVGTANFASDDYKQDSVVAMGETPDLSLEFTDQFGEVLAQDDVDGTVTFESLDTSVAIVDASSGKITPRSEGTAAVKVTVTKNSETVFSETVELPIVAKVAPTSIVANEDTLTINNTLSNKTATTTIEVQDQYGDAMTVDFNDVEVEVKTGKDYINGTPTIDVNGELSVEAVADKTGTATVELTYGTLTKTITVSVTEAGEIADYVVADAKTTLDKNTSDTEADDNYNADEMTFSVTPVDANGVAAGEDEAFTYQVKDSKGTVVTDYTTAAQTATINVSDLKVDETYTVTVKVGTLTVDSFTFNTVDTRVAPSYSVEANELTFSSDTVDLDAKINSLLDFGTNEDLVTVTDVEFVSSDESVIENIDSDADNELDTIDVKADGTTDIYLDTVTIEYDHDNDNGVNTDAEVYTLDLNGEKVSVTVDVAATADQAAADLVIAEIDAATTQDEIEAARASYVGLTASQQALVTNEADLQDKEQALVDAVTLATSASWGSTSTAGDSVVPDAQTGYTFTFVSSDNEAVVDSSGKVAGDGSATLTYTVEHTSSGKTASKTMDVTVAAD
jgi:hypothetical protein